MTHQAIQDKLPLSGMPKISFGPGIRSYQQTYSLTLTALDLGFRSFDTAELYGTESAIGAALKSSGIPRDEVWVTFKVRAYNLTTKSEARVAVERALDRLRINQIDLVLPHWPATPAGLEIRGYENVVNTRELGLAKMTGTSNATAQSLMKLRTSLGEWPRINQVHLSPLVGQRALREMVQITPVELQAYRTLESKTGIFKHPYILSLAKENKCSVAQLLVSWNLCNGHAVVVGASTAHQLEELISAGEKLLSDNTMHYLTTLDHYDELSPNPEEYLEI